MTPLRVNLIDNRPVSQRVLKVASRLVGKGHMDRVRHTIHKHRQVLYVVLVALCDTIDDQVAKLAHSVVLLVVCKGEGAVCPEYLDQVLC